MTISYTPPTAANSKATISARVLAALKAEADSCRACPFSNEVLADSTGATVSQVVAAVSSPRQVREEDPASGPNPASSRSVAPWSTASSLRRAPRVQGRAVAVGFVKVFNNLRGNVPSAEEVVKLLMAVAGKGVE